MAEFQLEEDQKQIRDAMRKFASEELRKVARECDETRTIPEGLLDKVWQLGICAQSIPEKYDGYELDRSIVTSAIMSEELAWGDLSLAIAALSPLTMMVPILEFGTEDQKAEWLPKFCGEQFFPATCALVEPRITFSPYALRTTLEDAGDTVVLKGSKCMVPMAEESEHILVYASKPGESGSGGVEAVIVDKGAAGMTIGEREKNMGLRSLPLYPVTFEGCVVDKGRVVGGAKGIDFSRLLNLSRTILNAMAVGVSRASWEYALSYAKERKAFGEPIASRQAIAFMLAEMAMEIEGMRLLNWRAAWRLDKQEDATRDATLARRYCSEQTMRIVDYGVQILGGHGYIREHPVEMWFRNGRAFSSMEGLGIA